MIHYHNDNIWKFYYIFMSTGIYLKRMKCISIVTCSILLLMLITMLDVLTLSMEFLIFFMKLSNPFTMYYV